MLLWNNHFVCRDNNLPDFLFYVWTGPVHMNLKLAVSITAKFKINTDQTFVNTIDLLLIKTHILSFHASCYVFYALIYV